MKNLFIKGLPPDLARKIKVTAALREMKIRDLVIAALEAYLAAGRESRCIPAIKADNKWQG